MRLLFFVFILFKTSAKTKATEAFFHKNDVKIRYLTVGEATKPLLVVLHGSPGKAENYRFLWQRFHLEDHFQIIAVDRPNYGQSRFGSQAMSVLNQATYIADLIDSLRNERPVHWVGYSYGGPVASVLAAKLPSKSLLLLAPALEPKAELQLFFTPWIYQSRFEKWIGTWGIANYEKYEHAGYLDEVLPFYGQITCPTILMHGTWDMLIYTRNAHFAQSKFTKTKVEIVWLKRLNHTFFFNKRRLIKDTILKVLN